LIIAYANDFVIGAKIKISDGPSDLASKIIGDRIFTYSSKGNEAGTAYPEVFIGAFNLELTEDFYKKFTYSDASFSISNSDYNLIWIQEFGTKIAFLQI